LHINQTDLSAIIRQVDHEGVSQGARGEPSPGQVDDSCPRFNSINCTINTAPSANLPISPVRVSKKTAPDRASHRMFRKKNTKKQSASKKDASSVKLAKIKLDLNLELEKRSRSKSLSKSKSQSRSVSKRSSPKGRSRSRSRSKEICLKESTFSIIEEPQTSAMNGQDQGILGYQHGNSLVCTHRKNHCGELAMFDCNNNSDGLSSDSFSIDQDSEMSHGLLKPKTQFCYTSLKQKSKE
jgi:hypothetical protein